MASLNTYLQQTQRFLRDVTQKQFDPADLIDWINQARGQLAGDSESIRFIGVFTSIFGGQVYPFSSINVNPEAQYLKNPDGSFVLNPDGSKIIIGGISNGIEGVLAVRNVWYLVGSGQKLLRPRPFEWFSFYELNTPVPKIGPPQAWAQYGQGASGSIYVSPIPDITYTQQVDCVCYPAPLVNNTSIEALPYLWTDAVPYFAAYLALVSPQVGAQNDSAQAMLKLYGEFVLRARRASTPGVLPFIYPQIPNPVRPNQLGMSSQGGGNAG